ncbi:uncharacterized protein [Watersipora subatra]|uniref:uncharacterized protein n=1 Tax=Watersipora subatra TaxID=2589382 RepID=UPI00355C30B5
MDDRGPLQWFLGIDFTRHLDGTYPMSQERYARSILQRFNMGDCKPADTPAAMGLQLTNPTDEEHNAFLDTKFPYRQAIGSLIYLMTATRPDISWVVSKLSQFLERPGHTTAVKRVFRYIKGTLTHNLHFTKTTGTLTGYTDSDWRHQQQTINNRICIRPRKRTYQLEDKKTAHSSTIFL